MTQKANHAYGERIMEGFQARSARERNELFAAHEGAYRLVEGLQGNLIDPSGLTSEGTAALDAFARAVGVEQQETEKSPKKGSKKAESNE